MGTLTVNPVVASAVAKGTPVVAVLAPVVNWQLKGVALIAGEKVTPTVVLELIDHAPARMLDNCDVTASVPAMAGGFTVMLVVAAPGAIVVLVVPLELAIVSDGAVVFVVGRVAPEQVKPVSTIRLFLWANIENALKAGVTVQTCSVPVVVDLPRTYVSVFAVPATLMVIVLSPPPLPVSCDRSALQAYPALFCEQNL